MVRGKMEGWEGGNWKGKVAITSARSRTREKTASKEEIGGKRPEGRGDVLVHRRNNCKPRWKKAEGTYRKERVEKKEAEEMKGRKYSETTHHLDGDCNTCTHMHKCNDRFPGTPAACR